MAQIVTKKGVTILVDDEDLHRLSQFNWHIAKGYPVTNTWTKDGKRRLHYLHREILGLEVGNKTKVDHKNCDKLDARKANLRICSVAQNNYNRKLSSQNISGYKGVSWCPREKKWRATIVKSGRQTFLGYFEDPAHAYLAYCEGAVKIHGEFANFG